MNKAAVVIFFLFASFFIASYVSGFHLVRRGNQSDDLNLNDFDAVAPSAPSNNPNSNLQADNGGLHQQDEVDKSSNMEGGQDLYDDASGPGNQSPTISTTLTKGSSAKNPDGDIGQAKENQDDDGHGQNYPDGAETGASEKPELPTTSTSSDSLSGNLIEHASSHPNNLLENTSSEKSNDSEDAKNGDDGNHEENKPTSHFLPSSTAEPASISLTTVEKILIQKMPLSAKSTHGLMIKSTTEDNDVNSNSIAPASATNSNPTPFRTLYPWTSSIAQHNSQTTGLPHSAKPTFRQLYYTGPSTGSYLRERPFSTSADYSANNSPKDDITVTETDDIKIASKISTTAAHIDETTSTVAVTLNSTTPVAITEMSRATTEGTTGRSKSTAGTTVEMAFQTTSQRATETSSVTTAAISLSTLVTRKTNQISSEVTSTTKIVDIVPGSGTETSTVPVITSSATEATTKQTVTEHGHNRKRPLVYTGDVTEGEHGHPYSNDNAPRNEIKVTSPAPASPTAKDVRIIQQIEDYGKKIMKEVGAFKVSLILLAIVGVFFISIFCCCKVCKKKGYRMRQRRLKEFGQEKEFLLRDRNKGNKYSNDTVTLLDGSSEDEF